MTPSLGQFQADFIGAIWRPDGHAGLHAQPAFAVYRNTIMSACIDALQANFPSVSRLVGSDWFRAAAAEHVRSHPPQDGRLMSYGAQFADFLAAFEPARDLPYLAEVARLDRFWFESHQAPDALPVDAAWLAALPPELLAETRLAPHPAARWRWFADAPIYTIWRRNREVADTGDELAWQAEGALLMRPADGVEWQLAGRADCAFLDACGRGLCLGEAAEAALDAQRDADVARLLSRLLCAGALTQSNHASENIHD